MDLESLRYNSDGLIPAIIQDDCSGAVLMMAYMNRESINKTVKTGETWFWSRSRRELWHKGQSSGNVQAVKGIYLDCDRDTLLIRVTQKGAACHEGYMSCFHYRLGGDGSLDVEGDQLFNPDEVYRKR